VRPVRSFEIDRLLQTTTEFAECFWSIELNYTLASFPKLRTQAVRPKTQEDKPAINCVAFGRIKQTERQHGPFSSSTLDTIRSHATQAKCIEHFDKNQDQRGKSEIVDVSQR
jgi:hypothetical protein